MQSRNSDNSRKTGDSLAITSGVRQKSSQKKTVPPPNAWFEERSGNRLRILARPPPTSSARLVVLQKDVALRKPDSSPNNDTSSWPSLGENAVSKPSVAGGPVSFADKLKSKPPAASAAPETAASSGNEEPQDNPPSDERPPVVDADGVKRELTEEEREKIREKRKERRKREKEKKKKLKEEQKRLEMVAPKSSKIKMVTSDILQRVQGNHQPPPPKRDSFGPRVAIRFMDEEYPSLAVSDVPTPKKSPEVITRTATDERGRVISDAESGSDWETEVEGDKDGRQVEMGDHQPVPEVIHDDQPMSYCSILKREKAKTKNETAVKVPEQAGANEELEKKEEQRKVKKKDPINIDLWSVLVKSQGVKKKQAKNDKKEAKVLGSKITRDGRTGGNLLDSSAPTKRRGKEREKPKKKRKSKLKKIILEEREERRNKRLTGDGGVILKANPISDPFEDDEKKVTKEETVDPPKEVVEVAPVPAEEIQPPTDSKIDPINDEPLMKAKCLLHSRKFRDYCDHVLNPELDELVGTMLQDLVRFQDRLHESDPVKAKAKRRYVVGLREAKKFLTVKKVTCLILAPDLERVETKGGLNDFIGDLIQLAKEHKVPYVFAMHRRKLGRCCRRKVPISCVAVMNYMGSEHNFKKIVELLEPLRDEYNEKLAKALVQVGGQPPDDVVVEEPPVINTVENELVQGMLQRLKC